jgi:ABC-2 type transport system ATP-binding protein
MKALAVQSVSKSYNGFQAVCDLSFEVEPGEIFGLLGPNGAGKTTTIRMMMDIIKPDAGQITLLGQPLTEPLKDRIGYLPEERGLYRGLKVIDTLVYLALLKGIDRRTAARRSDELLQRVDLADYRNRKVNELSKGMQQKLQFVATIIHDPDLVVLDEPFAGLDPINTQLIKEMIGELRDRGKTVILSTHMMSQVEEMANRILLIHRGRAVLYGPLEEIQARYAGNAVRLQAEGNLEGLAGVQRMQPNQRGIELVLTDGTSPQDILRQLIERGVTVKRFEIATPPLADIFIAAVESTP